MLLSSGRSIIKHVLYGCVNKPFFREQSSLDSARCKLDHIMKMKRMIIKLACAEEEMTIIFLENGIAQVSPTHESFTFVVPTRPFFPLQQKNKMNAYLGNLSNKYLLDNAGRGGGGYTIHIPKSWPR